MASFFVSRQSKFSRLQLASLQRYQCVFPLYLHDNDFITCQDNNYFQFYSALYDFCHAVTPCSFEKRTYVCHTLLVYCLLSFLEVTLFFVCFFLSMFFRASPPPPSTLHFNLQLLLFHVGGLFERSDALAGPSVRCIHALFSSYYLIQIPIVLIIDCSDQLAMVSVPIIFLPQLKHVGKTFILLTQIHSYTCRYFYFI